jgi:hypothetical protein
MILIDKLGIYNYFNEFNIHLTMDPPEDVLRYFLTFRLG